MISTLRCDRNQKPLISQSREISGFARYDVTGCDLWSHPIALRAAWVCALPVTCDRLRSAVFSASAAKSRGVFLLKEKDIVVTGHSQSHPRAKPVTARAGTITKHGHTLRFRSQPKNTSY
jgi:hypothetical protein